jgi:hypothetical protein
VAAVLASGRRAGAPATIGVGGEADDARGRFVDASRRMAQALQRSPAHKPVDPGATLIDLLGFADAVTRNRPPRPPAPLEFPVLSAAPRGPPRLATPGLMMSVAGSLGGLAGRIVAAHEMLDAMGVTHQFGGAVALAWYRNPRATTDIDLDIEEMIAWGTTIRVARGTRDLLAEQARERGISLAALLAEIAHKRARETIFGSERLAICAEVQNQAVLEEMYLWEATLVDGID